MSTNKNGLTWLTVEQLMGLLELLQSDDIVTHSSDSRDLLHIWHRFGTRYSCNMVIDFSSGRLEKAGMVSVPANTFVDGKNEH